MDGAPRTFIARALYQGTASKPVLSAAEGCRHPIQDILEINQRDEVALKFCPSPKSRYRQLQQMTCHPE
jgi:hypothetical protein